MHKLSKKLCALVLAFAMCLSTPAYSIMEEYTTVQGAAISHEGLRESLNGEDLNLDKAIDGSEDTMANVSNTTDLQGKSITVEYAQAPTGLRILSGSNGDKLTAPVAVYLSTDGTTFGTSPVATLTSDQITKDGDVRTHEVLFANPDGAKYVKLLFTDNSPGGWSPIREIYGLNGVVKTQPGQDNANLALNATAASSANETSGFSQEKANDGDLSTRWSSGTLDGENPQWLRLDFGAPTTFNCVRLFWEKSGGKAYQIQTSDNGTDWADVATVTDGQPSETRTLTFDAVTARYVRVLVTENFSDIWTCVSIYEMEVYNNSWDFIRTQAEAQLQNALRLFASHAAKSQDHTSINDLFNAYKSDPTKYQDVVDEMQRIVDACQLILTLKDSDNQKLVNLEKEIRPWVYRLNDMCQIIIDSLQALHGEESQRFDHLMNAIYLTNGIDTLDKYKTESLEGQGTSQTISTYIVNPGATYILPFARSIMTQASQSFFSEAPGPFAFTNTNVEGWAMAKAGNIFTVTDGETVTLTSGSYVQFDLAQLITLGTVDGLDTSKVQISLDGKSWSDFASGAQARYLRLMNDTAQEVSVDLTQVSITAQVVGIASVTSSTQFWEPNNYPTGNINDYNNTTFVWLTSQAKGTSLTVTYDAVTNIDRMEFATTSDGDAMKGKLNLEYQDADGNWISVGTVDSDDFVDGSIAVNFDSVQAKAIRATVAESRSGNWLKVTACASTAARAGMRSNSSSVPF